MKKQYLNIYESCRINAGFDRIDAAEELGVSKRSLDDYEDFDFETGAGRRPPDDVVIHMAELYGSKTLIDRHIYENTEAGREKNIKVKDLTVAEALIKYQAAKFEVDSVENVIRKIVAGNDLSTRDENTISKFTGKFEEFISSAISFRCSLEGWLEKKEIKINERRYPFGKGLYAWS